MLNMPVKKIKESISLREEYWENIFETNCYAFALGLDIPENNICKNSYQPGIIASKTFNISLNELARLKIEDKMILDLRALKIGFKLSEVNTKQEYISLGNYWCNLWDVLLFLNENDFHFARINYNGEMYHKIGYFGFPQKTSIEEIEKSGYSLSKIYRLRYWEKRNNY